MPDSVLHNIKSSDPFGRYSSPGVISAFSLRSDKNMSLCYGDTAGSLDNRRRFLGPLGIDYRDLTGAKQVHGDHVVCVRGKDKGKGALSYDSAIENTDALITAEKGLPLAILTADCLSVFLYDPGHQAIGLVHAGWRGSQKGICVKAVEAMREYFQSDPLSLRAGFGPSIRQCCFETGEELEEAFPQDIVKRDGRFYLDLPGVNFRQLLKVGLKQKNIFDPLLCTFCQADDFFSFRREKDSSGRILSVIMLKR